MFRLLPRAKRASAALSSRFSAWNSKSRLSPAALASAVFSAALASGAVGAGSAVAAREGGAGQLSNLSVGAWGGALLFAPLLGRPGATSPEKAAGVASKSKLRASRVRPLEWIVGFMGFFAKEILQRSSRGGTSQGFGFGSLAARLSGWTATGLA